MGDMHVCINAKVYLGRNGVPLKAVGPFELELKSGSTTALVGPSGCGKTTILNILLGLDTKFDGVVTGRPERIGAVFQEPRLLPWRTVGENIALAAPDVTLERVREMLGHVDLLEAEHNYPGTLSLGMARRVSLARALAIAPELCVLDEPLVSLDAKAAHELRDLIARMIAASGATTILVTHDVDEALALADTIVVLSGRPARILEVLDTRRTSGPASLRAGDTIRHLLERR